MTRIFLCLLGLIIMQVAQAQDSSRTIKATRTSLPIKIDGNVNEDAWKFAPAFTDFVEMKPTFNKPENEDSKTEAWMLYDDDAIYFAGICREPSMDSISTELVGRDKIGINDFVGLLIDTYQDLSLIHI